MGQETYGLYDKDEKARLLRTLFGLRNPTFDFYSILPSGFAWASSAFTSGSSAFSNGSLLVYPDGTASSRHFLYKDYGAGGIGFGHFFMVASPITSSTSGTYGGLRIDAGGDGNYIELTLQMYNDGTSNMFRQRVCWRTGSGTVNTTYGTPSLFAPPIMTLYLQVNGSTYSSWNPSCLIRNDLGESGNVFLAESASGFTWTPQRVGIILGNDLSGTAPTWNNMAVYQLQFTE